MHRLFRDHPPRLVTLPWGTVVTLPFHAYDVRTTVIAGTTKLEPMARWLVPEGLVPVRLRDDTTRRGAAWLWFLDYRDSNYGSFQQLGVGFASARDTFRVPLRNAASPLAALAHPASRTFLRWLFTTSEEVVTLGREVWGFPSERAEVSWGDAGRRIRGRAVDASGREVVDLDVRHRGGALRRVVGAFRAGRAMGFEQAAALSISPQFALTLVTPQDVKASRTPLRLHGRPVLYRWKSSDTLRLGTRSECGAALAELGFEPQVVLRHPSLRFLILHDPKSLKTVPADRIRYEDDL